VTANNLDFLAMESSGMLFHELAVADNDKQNR
jgi:hypothetical protein